MRKFPMHGREAELRGRKMSEGGRNLDRCLAIGTYIGVVLVAVSTGERYDGWDALLAVFGLLIGRGYVRATLSGKIAMPKLLATMLAALFTICAVVIVRFALICGHLLTEILTDEIRAGRGYVSGLMPLALTVGGFIAVVTVIACILTRLGRSASTK